MTLTAASLIDNRILIVDSLLQSIAEDLDIPPGKYKEAVDRYTAVGRWLEAGHYPGTSGEPSIYVQGSFRLGTVVRPLKEGRESDYDIDLACQLQATVHTGQHETLAELLGLNEAVALLQQTLDEEKETDAKLTELSMSEVSVEGETV